MCRFNASVCRSAVRLAVQELDPQQLKSCSLHIQDIQDIFGSFVSSKNKATSKSCINLSDGPRGQQIKYLKGLFIESKVLFCHNPALAIYDMIISGLDILPFCTHILCGRKETLLFRINVETTQFQVVTAAPAATQRSRGAERRPLQRHAEPHQTTYYSDVGGTRSHVTPGPPITGAETGPLMTSALARHESRLHEGAFQ